MFKLGIIKRLSLVILSFLSIPSVLALNEPVNLAKAFEIVFGPKGLGGIMHSTWGNYGLTLIFYFVLFYSVFAAALKKVKIFEGEGSLGLNSAGKMFSVAVSALACLSIFAFKDASQQLIKSVLSPMGIFGGMALGIIFLIFIYRQFKDSGSGHPKSWALLLTGVLLFAGGSMIGEQDNMLPAIGMIMVIMGIISFVVGIRRAHEPLTAAEERREERIDNRTAAEQNRETNTELPQMEGEDLDALRRVQARQAILQQLLNQNNTELQRIQRHLGGY